MLPERRVAFCVAAAALTAAMSHNGHAEECVSWNQRWPGARDQAAQAYDSTRNVTVVFGGYDGVLLGDTWEWNGTTWVRVAIGGPSARSSAAIAYDASRGVTVLFGGNINNGENGANGETWEWDGTVWNLRATGGPSPRYSARMAYDASRHVCVLFGGMTGAWTNGETWEWNGTAWTLRGTGGPAPRQSHAMAYDSARQVTILFGGSRTGDSSGRDGETWEWNGSTWTLRATAGPSPRLHHTMAYDTDHDCCVLLGGWDTHTDDETWSWNGTSWSYYAVQSPRPRHAHAMSYDSMRHKTVMFGGIDDPDILGDTWEFDGNAWTRRGDTPIWRNSPTLTYDTLRGVSVLFGGNWSVLNTTGLGDTWEWDGYCWTWRTASGPAPRYCHSAAYDSIRGLTVLFGGFISGYGIGGDTSEWDGATWQQRNATGPVPRWRHAMAFDSFRARTIMYGGDFNGDGSAPTSETWEWDGSGWLLRTSGGPAPRLDHALAYDGDRHVVVLFGGGAPGSIFGDTWEWSGTTWTLRSNEGPPARYGHTLTFDSARHVTLLSGGCTAGNIFLTDTWEWDGNGWSLVNNDASSGLWRSSVAFDSARSAVVRFGGLLGTINVDSTAEILSIGIVEQPVNQSVPVPQPVTFTVQAAGSGGFSFRWRKGGEPLTDGGRITGASTNMLHISPTWMSDAGSYDVVVTNDCGSVTSDPATLTLTAARGDLNCDGVINFKDINPFVLALSSWGGYLQSYPNCDIMLADINQDGYVTFADINPFVAILSGQ
jgi:hypothetical protein